MTEMEQDILYYLLDHPDASDTLNGVVHWWLVEQRVKREAEQAEKALANLVHREWLVGRRGADSQIHYRLNPEKADEVAMELGRKAD